MPAERGRQRERERGRGRGREVHKITCTEQIIFGQRY